MEACGGIMVDARSEMTKDARFAFVPCGKDVRVVALRTGATVRVLKGHTEAITQVTLNPANRLQVITSARDNTIRVWDYDEAACLRTFKTRYAVVGFFVDGHDGRELFWVEQFPKNGKQTRHRICHRALTDPSISLNLNLQNCDVLIANSGCSAWAYHWRTRSLLFAEGKSMHLLSTQTGVRRTFRNSTDITVIATSPESDEVATGDAQGKIKVWYGCFRDTDTPPVMTTFHWHAHGVSALTFTNDGAYLLSGGEEGVFVMWQVESGTKQFLPRLGAPITQIAAAQNSQYYLVSLEDNSVLILDAPAFGVAHTIVGCRRAPVAHHRGRSVGLVRDPTTDAVVTNGRQGMLQMYDMQRDRHVTDIDVVGRTFISRAFRRHVTPTFVTHTAFSHDGRTLATVERRHDRLSIGDLRLKFWQRDPNTRGFSLNTLVDPPHENGVKALLSHPHKPLFITVSMDGAIKMWAFKEEGDPDDPRRTSPHWHCCAVADYNRLPCQAAAMAPDGSRFVVACNSFLTVWDTDTLVLERAAALSNPKMRVTTLAFTGDGRGILLTTRQHTCLFDANSMDMVHAEAQSPLLLTVAHEGTAASGSNNRGDDGDGDDDETIRGLYAVAWQEESEQQKAAGGNSGGVFKIAVYRADRPASPVYEHTTQEKPKAMAFWKFGGADDVKLVYLDDCERICICSLDGKQRLETTPVTSKIPLYGLGSEDLDSTRRAYQRFFGIGGAAAVVGDSAKHASHIQGQREGQTATVVVGKTPLEETFAVPSHLMPPMRLLSAQFVDLTLAQAAPHTTVTSSSSSSAKGIETTSSSSDKLSSPSATRTSDAKGDDATPQRKPVDSSGSSSNSKGVGERTGVTARSLLESLLTSPLPSAQHTTLRPADFAFAKSHPREKAATSDGNGDTAPQTAERDGSKRKPNAEELIAAAQRKCHHMDSGFMWCLDAEALKKADDAAEIQRMNVLEKQKRKKKSRDKQKKKQKKEAKKHLKQKAEKDATVTDTDEAMNSSEHEGGKGNGTSNAEKTIALPNGHAEGNGGSESEDEQQKAKQAKLDRDHGSNGNGVVGASTPNGSHPKATARRRKSMPSANSKKAGALGKDQGSVAAGAEETPKTRKNKAGSKSVGATPMKRRSKKA